jgi:hypothetical protein
MKKALDVARLRLHNQLVTRHAFERPGEVVRWMGAVQAQDYAGALWAVGLRLSGATASDVERAVAEREIVRTWPMRGTLHFVPPEDTRWMLELLTPRVVARSAGRYRQLGLDEATLSRSRRTVERALAGGRRLTRPALYRKLEAAGIATAEQRGIHILGWLAQKGVVCFGPREGKQPTLTLLDEWVPEPRRLAREEALAELAKRYFTSHGPATLHDFAWWSGLPMADARAALAAVASDITSETAGERTLWFPPSGAIAKRAGAHLLPVYDEYTVAYRDRSDVLDPALARRAGNGIFGNVVVVDGQVVGTWTKRSIDLFEPLDNAQSRALDAALERYQRFVRSV